MNTFLEKIGLIQNTQIKLKTNKTDFVKVLNQNIDQSDLGFGSSFFEVFSSSKNDLKGYVNPSGFKLRKKRKMFQQNIGFAIADGSFRQKDEYLEIDITVNGFSKGLVFFFVFVFFIYIIFISVLIVSDDAPIIFMLPFLLVHASLMLGLPYYFTKKSVKNTKRDLEKEFIFLINKHEN